MRSRAYHRWGAGGCTACGAKERVGIGPCPNNPRLNATDPRDARIAELEAELARVQGIAFGGFVAGAKWWEYKKTGATMWGSDVDEAEKAASERYPYAPHPLVVEAKAQRDAALAENARLEALIVSTVEAAAGIDADLHAEYDRIKAKP